MILFRQDYSRFPTTIVDYETKNESFLRMASLYRKMNVENCLFHLTLFQPQLQGIDPHDESLSEDVKFMIGLECQFNFWYFIREVVRIPAIAGPIPIRYEANRGNLALSWTFLNNVDIALIQPRQTGKSVSTDCIMVWLVYMSARNSEITMLTKDHTLRIRNVERLKRIRGLLPPFLINTGPKDSDNQIELTCREYNNIYLTGVAQSNEIAANNLGRGLTTPITHIDEAPYFKYIGTTLPAALSAGGAARDEAEFYGRPYGNIFTTTAGKKDDRDGKYMFDLIHGGAYWNELFLDSQNKDHLKNLIRKNCSGRKMIINATFSHRQLGKTDEWLYQKITETNSKGEEADRDYFNVWTSGTQSSPLTAEINDRIKNSEMDPLYTEISKEAYLIRWYHTEDELNAIMNSTHVILGLDTSDAIGRDAIALIFTNSQDLSVMGTAVINETNLIVFSRFLAEILIKYPNVILIPERKSSAPAIIDSLLIQLPRFDIDPFKRIYNLIFDHRSERPKDYEDVQVPMARRTTMFYDKWKKAFGFTTSSTSRELLYGSVFQNAAKTSGHLIKDRILSSEIRGLVVKNGRIDHSNIGNDDTVIAWLMTHWFLTHSKNLNLYGIDNHSVLSQVITHGKPLDPFEEYELREQERFYKEIGDIYQRLSQCFDEYTISELENRLIFLSKKIKYDNKEPLSIDNLINQAATERKNNLKKKMVKHRERPHRPFHDKPVITTYWN